MRKLIFAAISLAPLLFQQAQALNVTLLADNRLVGDETPASFGADFDFSYGTGAYQTSSVPQAVDAETYAFTADGATYRNGYCTEFYGCEDLAWEKSNFNILFTVDQDAALNLAGSFEYLGGSLGGGGYRIALNDIATGVAQIVFETGTVTPTQSYDYLGSIDLIGGHTYQLDISAIGYTNTDSAVYKDSLVEYGFTANITTVPVPATFWLFGSGLGLLGWFRRNRH